MDEIQINLIHESANNRERAVVDVASMFNDININSKTVVAQVNEVDTLTGKIEKSSIDILNRVTDITKFTEDVSVSVEKVLTGATEQNNRIKNIVESFMVLENLVIDLKDLTMD
ncbi:MAG: hypothetical protein KAX49_03215 [Halanaerobiales bacterium]|nr:hypothetical protein [Halanaerobiales bacterium]